MLKGETYQIAVATKLMTLKSSCFNKFEKGIPPRPPPKPKKQPPALPSTKPVVIKYKPLPKPKINPSPPIPTLIEKQQWVTEHKMVVSKYLVS